MILKASFAPFARSARTSGAIFMKLGRAPATRYSVFIGLHLSMRSDHSPLDTLYRAAFDRMSAQPDQVLIRPDYMPPCDRSMTVNNRFLSCYSRLSRRLDAAMERHER